MLSFSLGAGPVPALLLPEIFASRIRAKAVALSLGMHWVSQERRVRLCGFLAMKNYRFIVIKDKRILLD